MTSLNSTILGCFNCLRTDISLKVVLGIPSSSTSRRMRYLINIIEMIKKHYEEGKQVINIKHINMNV